jgi:hypothetical protein
MEFFLFFLLIFVFILPFYFVVKRNQGGKGKTMRNIWELAALVATTSCGIGASFYLIQKSTETAHDPPTHPLDISSSSSSSSSASSSCQFRYRFQWTLAESVLINTGSPQIMPRITYKGMHVPLDGGYGETVDNSVVIKASFSDNVMPHMGTISCAFMDDHDNGLTEICFETENGIVCMVPPPFVVDKGDNE